MRASNSRKAYKQELFSISSFSITLKSELNLNFIFKPAILELS